MFVYTLFRLSFKEFKYSVVVEHAIPKKKEIHKIEYCSEVHMINVVNSTEQYLDNRR